MTDSVDGHLSDLSANTIIQKQQMDVVIVLDLLHTENLQNRRKALEEVRQACSEIGATCNHILFEKLDFGEANVLDMFYNADVVIIDISLQVQQSALFYHLGVRESFKMKQNILIYNDVDPETTMRLKVKKNTNTSHTNIIIALHFSYLVQRIHFYHTNILRI